MSTEHTDGVRVYRFRDSVAIEIGDGPTRYLALSLARALAVELADIGDDIESTLFSQSRLGTAVLSMDRMMCKRAEGNQA